jgi:hypothetical protein
MAFCKKWGVLALVGLLLVLGCSKGSLDRDTAFRKITQNANAKRKLRTWVGRVGRHCSVLGDKVKSELSMDPNADISSVVAAKAGYVTFAPDGKDFWKISLTDKGQAVLDAQHEKPYARKTNDGCDYELVNFLIAKQNVSQVTGITGDDASAEAEYRWTWELTELGAALREQGDIYSKLTSEQQDDLRRDFGGDILAPAMELPVPSEEEIKNGARGTMKFKKYDNGWHAQY